MKLHNIFTFFLSILPSIASKNPINCDRSCPGGQFNHVPYPFGFSSGCQIQLNCTSTGTVFINEFPIQHIVSEGLLVNLPANCGRTSDTINHLYGENYAPMSTNNILMRNCKERTENCLIPMTLRDQLANCSGGGYSNVSCFSGDISRMFFDYENVTRIGCRILVSGIVSEMNGQAMSMDMQVLKLGWWLKGACDCSPNADCTKIVSPVDGSDGHRCMCKSGFDGNGYKAGSGCQKPKGSKEVEWIIIIGFSCGIAGIMFLLLVILYRETRLSESQGVLGLYRVSQFLGAARNKNIEMFIRNHENLALKRYKYSEIKKMTNSFQEKLGEGGYGSVYKGRLADGHLVAVKVLDEATGNGEDFINEVASISKTSHVNIVSLLGLCYDGKKRALMYEFMPNRSLDKFLGGDGCHLDWSTLFLITKGIARGLEYLHRGCNTRIVHFDIKPHNILLDEEFVPKIADFGQAKLCKRKESIVPVLGAIGTIGYMSPEVFFNSPRGASHKSDVYSYGMMVLEMCVASKANNLCTTITPETYVPEWIYNQVEGGHNLEICGVTTKEEVELARKMMIVSLWCIMSDPSDRPSISKVLEMLEGNFESLQVPPRRFWLSPPTHGMKSPPH